MLAIILIVWFAGVVRLAMQGYFVPAPGALGVNILAALCLPVVLFLVAYYLYAGVRKWVNSVDPFLVTLFQTWRVVGFLLIPFAMYGLLPGGFAWPAGVGDVLIGLIAAWVVYQLKTKPGFIKEASFKWFHLAGLFDFAVAIATNIYYGQYLAPELNKLTQVLPLVLLPAFFAPLFIIWHIIALVHHNKKAKA